MLSPAITEATIYILAPSCEPVPPTKMEGRSSHALLFQNNAKHQDMGNPDVSVAVLW